jgi:hypothetical protein
MPGPVDGTINVGFRGQVDNAIRVEIRNQLAQMRRIADVGLDEAIPGAVGNRCQR